jgi:putative FmdB family regulatory protein
MPVYDFKCGRCSCLMSINATLQEKEAGLAPVCPHCGSKQMEQQFHSVSLSSGIKESIDQISDSLNESKKDLAGLKEILCSHGSGCRCKY